LGLRESELLAELLPSDLELLGFLAENPMLLMLLVVSRVLDEPLLLIFEIILLRWFFGDSFELVLLPLTFGCAVVALGELKSRYVSCEVLPESSCLSTECFYLSTEL